MTAGEPPPATGQLDFVGSLLVADTRAFAEECLALLSAEGLSSDQLPELRERSKTLQLRARAAGIGGLAHHLGSRGDRGDGGVGRRQAVWQQARSFWHQAKDFWHQAKTSW